MSGCLNCGSVKICRLCKRKLDYFEDTLSHHKLFHPRTKEAKQCRELEKSWEV